MLTLPIVDRELRLAARNWRTYLTRVTTGLAALGMCLYLIWMASEVMQGAMAGMFILKATSYMAWMLCVFAGVSRTCDSLSSEKRSDTLGLLFLTHLKGFDIVLGKLIASSLSSIYLLIGVLPILSIPVLLGGVSAIEMVRIPVVLLNSLFLAQSIGLLVSSLARTQRVASGISGFVMIFLAVFVPMLAEGVKREWEQPTLALLLNLFSPIYAQEMSFAATTGLSTNFFWTAILVQFCMALSFFIATCLIIPHSWKIPAGSSSWREKFERWTHGTVLARTRRRTKLLTRNPFFWLSCRDRFAPAWPIVFAVTVLGVIGWCIYRYEIPKEPACVMLFAGLAVNDLTNRLRVASIAANRLAEDRQSGALEMILSTPISVAEIVKGQWMAIRHIQLPAYAFIFVFYLVLTGIVMEEVGATDGSYVVAGFFALVSIGDFFVLGYVAIWTGMRVSNIRHATGSALFRVFLIPWFVWLGLLPFLHEVAPRWVRRFFDSNEPYSYLGTGFAIWATSSIMALIKARRYIKWHFREAATDRYVFEERFSFLRRLKRKLSWTQGGSFRPQPPVIARSR